jgi:hypothetical protein
MLWEEIRHAQQLHQTHDQRPSIFPFWLQEDQNAPTLSYWEFCTSDLLQALQSFQLWGWNGNVNTLVAELLPLLKEGRMALSSDHPWAIPWQQICTQPHLSIPSQQSIDQESASLPNPENSTQDSTQVSLGTLPPAIVTTSTATVTWDSACSSMPTVTMAGDSMPELPEGQVILDSPFYIPRPPIENRCFATIQQPGALIRIKAPRQMGKSSLLVRILDQAQRQGARTIHLNFQLANKRVFANSDTFLQWFCANLGLELGQLDAFTNCWQLAPIIGANQCCRAFLEQLLEQQVLADSTVPLTLGLDEVDRVFEAPEIADDFFGLLRALHEEAKCRTIWQRLRLIVVHSTEVYIPLDVNKSPFNVGLPIELPEFTPAQVQTLAHHHGLNWDQDITLSLMALVGGHPYLVRLSLYHLAQGDMTLEQILAQGAMELGIYSDHLRRHGWNLQKHAGLAQAMAHIIQQGGRAKLRSEQAFKLQSMGLITLDGNCCRIRCQLYRQYFGDLYSTTPMG